MQKILKKFDYMLKQQKFIFFIITKHRNYEQRTKIWIFYSKLAI